MAKKKILIHRALIFMGSCFLSTAAIIHLLSLFLSHHSKLENLLSQLKFMFTFYEYVAVK